jgi:predicted transcriptional regulator
MSPHGRDGRRARSTYRPAGPIREAASKRLLLLSYFSDEHRSATPQELSRALDLSTAAVEELAVDLVRAGCLERDETSGSYQLAGSGVATIMVKDER